MFRALFGSSSGGTVCTAICIFCVYYIGWLLAGLGTSSTPTLLAASRHNTHKNIQIAVYEVPLDDEQKSVRNM
jgi:hypothetical protein